jgi:hypothetical protein
MTHRITARTVSPMLIYIIMPYRSPYADIITG